MERIVKQIRQRWPAVKITLRADSGFCREALMSWCEAHGVDYVLGLARDGRLRRIIAPQMEEALRLRRQSGQAARVFTEFDYQTHDSWTRARRVVGKAELNPSSLRAISAGPHMRESAFLIALLQSWALANYS